MQADGVCIFSIRGQMADKKVINAEKEKHQRAEKERLRQLRKEERLSMRTPATRRTRIGGQAVLEGVMMKGERSVATAVRTQTGEITVESKYSKSSKQRSAFSRLPFVRGIVNLFSQLFEGTGLLLRSAEVYGDFAEPSKFEEKLAKKFKINPMNLVMGFSVIIGVALAIALFVFLPNLLTGLIFDIPGLENAHPAFQSLSEGLIMLVVFVLYIIAISIMKDIRRVFMYHGAEHKVINCYEHGLELTVENARKSSRQHSRCGTTFMFFVIAVSILVFALVNWALSALGWLTDSNVVNAFIKLAVKLLFLPVVAGISYELLKLLAKSDCLFVRILRAPGMALQLLTTKEPTDDMLEVSLTAFKTVLAMDANAALPELKFEIKIPYESARANLKEVLPDADESDLDWIIIEATGKKRSELSRSLVLDKNQFIAAYKIAEKMKDGMPLQYALGYTEFCGLRIEVNKNVLIPRPETEWLAATAIELINAESGEENYSISEKTAGDEHINSFETATAEAVETTTAEVVETAESAKTETFVVKTEGTEKNEDFAISDKCSNKNGNAERLRVLDLCTGSGAIAIAVKKSCGNKIEMTASDISGEALAIARANALNNGVEISFAEGDLFKPLEGEKFNYILVNPPYIPFEDVKTLDKKVKDFEPLSALNGGADGLDFYRRIEKVLPEFLKKGGCLIAEFGINQAESVKNIFGGYQTEIIKDLEGVDRIALVRK